ncbi:ubiquitin carboxyl-terminal hydrolase CYLD [Megalops cyprinoides]|uniref:ubiquitin carboxyl-terminal hydrolase CYLD n=1 Tax=Megalops cyprinoides TaxID=118141 RepID=UPI001863D881|nr:ubiquitin carboxyl-terminal hydrolase CYLD [Megalops cyprinoides]
MSGATDHSRRRRPPKMYMVESEHKVQDQLEGAIRLPRGSLCQVQEGGRGEQLWVKVLDSGSVVKIDRQVLLEVPADLASILEPMSDPESRFQMFYKPQQLQRLANLPLGAELWVKLGQSEELAEGVLRYRGNLRSGSNAVYFGVQLKGRAMGKGNSNGSHKGQQFFQCPEACAVFVAANRLALPPRASSSGKEAAGYHSYSQTAMLPRTADSAPAVGQRVCFPMGEGLEAGEVRFCGLLPGKSTLGPFVGILLDNPVGSWDGWFKDEQLCSMPTPQHGLLLPVSKVSKVSPEPRTQHHPRPTPNLKHTRNPPAPLVNKPQAPPSPTTIDQSRCPPRPPGPLSPSRCRGEVGGDQEEQAGLEAGPEAGLEVGSMVEVNDPPLFGVIRWIGQISGIAEPVAGLELDQELTAATDGSYLGERHFRCPANKGLFVKLRNCRRDSRFPAPEAPTNQVERCNSIAFAEWGSERVDENTPPVYGEEARELYSGRKRGIQGHLNSCYLDASLFSLFSCCSSVDWVMLCPSGPDDGPHRSHAQDLLRCEIVNPLRRYGYVCASKTMALRRILEAESSDTGFTSQEKDPEEFLNNLFQLLKVESLLKIRSVNLQTQECHLYQLFPPAAPSPPSPTVASPPSSPPLLPPSPNARLRVASVQTLLETSFLHTGLKFAEAPSCLPLLMPRFGKEYKMFDAILPSLSLDITDLLDDTLRQCSICQSVAEWECAQCYEDRDITPGCLKQYCHICNTQVHTHRKRLSHKPVRVGVPGGPWAGPVQGARQQLALFAVTCIQTSHYVSFVKHGPLPTDWLLFDSMADREGGENGFNVPQVRMCPEVSRYLSLSVEELGRLDPASLPGPARRLLCDAHMCLYHSPQLSLYK